MKMVFRGKEDVVPETIQTPFSENWYHDLKDIPSIDLLEKTLVGVGMSLFWRMNREDKPVYMEGDKVVSLYVVAFKREGGKMATVPKRVDEELWYLQIVKKFVLPRIEDLAAQPPTGTVKNVKGEKKGTRHSSDSWCDYVVVSDSLEGLAPIVMKNPKAKPRDAADIPASNADGPIDLESSPEPLLRTKAEKRKKN
ncbi:hypothetical protein Hanom_Chr06g00556761 [Helianthus anomalus]